MFPVGSVSVQGGAVSERAVNKIKGPALEMLAGAARPGQPTLPDGRGTLVPVRDRGRIHFWFDPCPFFPDLISNSSCYGKKLVPPGRILDGVGPGPGREIKAALGRRS